MARRLSLAFAVLVLSLGPAVPADSAQPGGSSNAYLLGVSCVGRSFCLAVGGLESANNKREFTLAERREGGRWQVTPTPNRANVDALNSVSCVSANWCMAVGGYFNLSSAGFALAERWNGKRWSITPARDPGHFLLTEFSAVSCVSRRDCEAVGSYDDAVTLAEHWDGRHWTVQHTPSPALTTDDELSSVSCVNADSCTAVGNVSNAGFSRAAALVEHWDGRRWSIQHTPSLRSYRGGVLPASVSCAMGSCLMIGVLFRRPVLDRPYASLRPTPLAERTDGTGWRRVAALPPDQRAAELSAVSCPAVDRCVAIGAISYPPIGPQFAEHQTDGGWRQARSLAAPAAGSPGLSAISCTSPRDCTAVGGLSIPALPTAPLAERWDGHSWHAQPAPS